MLSICNLSGSSTTSSVAMPAALKGPSKRRKQRKQDRKIPNQGALHVDATISSFSESDVKPGALSIWVLCIERRFVDVFVVHDQFQQAFWN